MEPVSLSGAWVKDASSAYVFDSAATIMAKMKRKCFIIKAKAVVRATTLISFMLWHHQSIITFLSFFGNDFFDTRGVLIFFCEALEDLILDL